MEVYRRPNRSDVHLSAQEEASLEAKTRDYFDGVAPQRHTKPQRSDYSTQYVDAFSSTPKSSIPEFIHFQHLENDPQEKKLVYKGSEVADEFVETEYYKDLNSVDKHHHTTGTGFIKVEKSGESFHIEPDNDTGCHHSCMCNPATNDWVPATSIEVDFNSDKHHHTTGTGFIKVEKSGESFHIEPDNDTGCHHSCMCNPATNDWVPATSIEVDFNSDKPNRSEN